MYTLAMVRVIQYLLGSEALVDVERVVAFHRIVNVLRQFRVRVLCGPVHQHPAQCTYIHTYTVQMVYFGQSAPSVSLPKCFIFS